MNDKELEQQISKLVRNQPLRRAPKTLQAGVWTQLRAANMPWWRRSFRHWPLLARGALIMVCLMIATGHLTQLQMSGAAREFGPLLLLNGSVTWFERLSEWMQTLFDFITLLMRHAPASWWSAGALLLGMSYALLALLGAAGYRVLYADSSGN